MFDGCARARADAQGKEVHATRLVICARAHSTGLMVDFSHAPLSPPPPSQCFSQGKSIASFTYLRLGEDLMDEDKNWNEFVRFAREMGAAKRFPTWSQIPLERQSKRGEVPHLHLDHPHPEVIRLSPMLPLDPAKRCRETSTRNIYDSFFFLTHCNCCCCREGVWVIITHNQPKSALLGQYPR